MTEAPEQLRVAIAQLDPIVGNVEGNLERARRARAEAARHDAELVVLSELFVAGYPPEDLVMKPAFLAACEQAVGALAADTADGGPGVILGVPLQRATGRYNAIAVLDGGRMIAERYKAELPNYGEFDEKRVFDAGPLPQPVEFRGVRLGVPICEDIWGERGVAEALADQAAELLVVPNASPYHRGKLELRRAVVGRTIRATGLPLIYCNQIGGQDELVFDGASFVVGADGALALALEQFEEQLAVCTLRRRAEGTWCPDPGPIVSPSDTAQADYHACMLGLRDYVNKNGFDHVVLGLSGGIDSALCAALCVDALGPKRVWAVMLPYRYTAATSLTDADACARALGCRYDAIPIAGPVDALGQALASTFEGTAEDVTEENLQARTRGTILMALSNKFGSMLVTTGNKSEMSVGYSTLYGDMNGGFNPVKDLYKMQVYALARWRNHHRPPGALGPVGEVIPRRILDKAPSAELRAEQTDQELLPPYPVLDDILECLIENEMSVDAIVARGHDRALVHRVEDMLYVAEYKRRQSAPGVKITRKNFGRDRRYPITNLFRDEG
jgi:NAD+ synthase